MHTAVLQVHVQVESCPVVLDMGVVDQSHSDDHGQEHFDLSWVVDIFVPSVCNNECGSSNPS